mmetsp:Transcript_285/g.700  ORF Transcript_285/g.700 Transcript_285/m.700 type:complete len:88 (+) Transcript_285:56-319(+)
MESCLLYISLFINILGGTVKIKIQGKLLRSWGSFRRSHNVLHKNKLVMCDTIFIRIIDKMNHNKHIVAWPATCSTRRSACSPPTTSV